MGFRQSGKRRIVQVIATLVISCAMLCAVTASAFGYSCTYAPIAGAGPSPMTVTLAAAGEAVTITTNITGNLLVNGIPCTGNPMAIKTGASAAANSATATGVIVNGGTGPDNVTIDFSVGLGVWTSMNAPTPALVTFPIMGRNIEADGMSELEVKTALGVGPNTLNVIGTSSADSLTFGGSGGAWTTETESDNNKSYAIGDSPNLPDWSYSGLQGVTLNGGSGADTVSSAGTTGGTGNPIGGYSEATLIGGSGNDTLLGGWGPDL
ncbi:MAG: hypothetical protein H7123_05890, partial [Thermoleophilia bacterium]|nr:hypothetical protein [Thermoleophilia bacterium]